MYIFDIPGNQAKLPLEGKKFLQKFGPGSVITTTPEAPFTNMVSL